MKNTLLLFITFLFFLKSYSQSSEFIINNKETFNEDLKFVAKNEKGLILSKIAEKKRIHLCFFNPETLLKNNEIELKYPSVNGEITGFQDLFYLKNRICLFTSLLNKDDQIFTLYVTQFNEKGEIISPVKQVDNIKWANKSYYYKYQISFSSDSIKLLIYHKLNEYIGKTTKSIFGLKILNEKTECVLDKEFNLPNDASTFVATNFLLDKNNNVSFIEKEYKNEDYYNISVVTYNKDEDKLIRNEIKIDEKRFLNLDLQLTPKDNILLSGAYAIDKNFGGSWEGISSLKGLFCSLIDSKTNNVIVQYKKDIDTLIANDKKTNFFGNANGFSFMVEDGKHLYRYRLKNTFQLDNDQIILLVQFEHSISGTYVKGPIIGINFNLKDEKKSWLKAFPFHETKKNGTNNKETFSYLAFKSNNKIKVIYNYNRNIEISPTGDFTDNEIFKETKENKNMFLSRNFLHSNNNELYVLGTEGDLGPNFVNYSICKIIFKN